jgi:hypothetical protein
MRFDEPWQDQREVMKAIVPIRPIDRLRLDMISSATRPQREEKMISQKAGKGPGARCSI